MYIVYTYFILHRNMPHCGRVSKIKHNCEDKKMLLLTSNKSELNSIFLIGNWICYYIAFDSNKSWAARRRLTLVLWASPAIVSEYLDGRGGSIKRIGSAQAQHSIQNTLLLDFPMQTSKFHSAWLSLVHHGPPSWSSSS